MDRIKVLIVDDSNTVRSIIRETLMTDADMDVVGEAANGKEAVEMVGRLKPDIVTMDINMPVMNGADAIETIMEENAVPIVVISDMGASLSAFELIEKGALDLMAKENIDFNNPEDFVHKIKLYARVKVIHRVKKRGDGDRDYPGNADSAPEKIVVIASSTGGPKALSVIIGALKHPFPYPILIAQHIENGFVDGLVDWINNCTPLNVVKALDGMRIAAGSIYISPSDKNMTLGSASKISLNEREPHDIFTPSCNKLMFSAAKIHKNRVIGVILTGMGDDGAKGMQEIKSKGGITIAQNEESCIVFGMPAVAIGLGCIDEVLPLSEIAGKLNRLAEEAKA